MGQPCSPKLSCKNYCDADPICVRYEEMSESTYIIKGIVHPERAQISLGPLRFEFLDPGTGQRAETALNIVLNQVTILVRSDVEWDIFDLRNVAKQLAADQLAIVGYIKGYAYEIEIRQILNTEKQIDYVYGIDIPCIEERNKEKDITVEATKIMAHCGGGNGIFVRRCLNDLIMAMKHPDDTAFYCYRALESLRHYCRVRFKIDGESDQWKMLGQKTGTAKDDIEFIREKAFPTRHGDVIGITSDERARMFLKTWDIVDAFFVNV